MIIFDLDGTLALIEHRRHLVTKPNNDWPAFFRACVDDLPNEPVIQCLEALISHSDKWIEIWSGRSDEVLAETSAWLVKHLGAKTASRIVRLRMRKAGDYRPDEVVKGEWLAEQLTWAEPIECVFEDRDRMVAMWRSHGIPCFQVAPGNF